MSGTSVASGFTLQERLFNWLPYCFMCIYLQYRQFPNSTSNIIGSLYRRVGSVNVDSAANVALLIFSVHGAAFFYFFILLQRFVSTHLLTLKRRRTVCYAFGKEDDCICVCSNSPTSKLLECKRVVFPRLNPHNFLFVFTVSAVVKRFGCHTSEICISTDKEEQSQLRVHFTKPLRPSSFFSHLTNFGLASKQSCFGVMCHSFVITNLSKRSLTTVKTSLPSENKIYAKFTKQGSTFTDPSLWTHKGLDFYQYKDFGFLWATLRPEWRNLVHLCSDLKLFLILTI